ncbi:MAG: hypothetical protein QXH32_01650 [Candidatus Caldarchaeum sp.]
MEVVLSVMDKHLSDVDLMNYAWVLESLAAKQPDKTYERVFEWVKNKPLVNVLELNCLFFLIF